MLLADLEPPSHFRGTSNVRMQHHLAEYKLDPYKFCGEYPKDVIPGKIIVNLETEDMLTALKRVARLRSWKYHVEFGVMDQTGYQVCRIDLGL